MITDTLDNLHKYTGLSPLLARVVDFVSSHVLENMPEGKHEVEGEDVWVSIQTARPRSREQAPLEVHREMMDIQIPLEGKEEQGFLPLSRATVLSASYDARADISFLSLLPQEYIMVSHGQFVLYLPGEGHAPGISENPFKKAVFKVKYQNTL